MKKSISLITLFASFCFLSGCVTEQYVKKTPTVRPYELKEGKSIQEKSGEYSGTLESRISEQKTGSEKEVSAPVPVRSGTGGRTAKPGGKDTGEKSSSSQEAIALKYETELQRGLNLLSQKRCSEAIELFSSLTIRYPEATRTQYYLSFAYDKCDDIREALKGYEEYVDIESDDIVFIRKSKNRIRELRDKKADEFIKEAQMLAHEHKYKNSLDILGQAYDLHPSTVVANKIVDKYFTYSVNLIAWDISVNSKSLQEKTVSVIPFTSLYGEESEQGKAVAREIKNKLINIQTVEVYERDDDSVKAILKEIEFGQSGSIDEKTRKNLGKLVNTEAIITGQVGYAADSLEINGWMINVETGKIISAKKVKILGWNIKDTDKYAEFNIKVWTDRKLYKIDDVVTINLTSNRDCFVTLLNVRSNGEIWELYPNKYKPDNFTKANVRYTIPSVTDNFRLAIVDPPGKEYIKAIATSAPISTEQIMEVLSEDNSVLITSTNSVIRRDNSIFRSISSSEMRGLHKILTRGVGVLSGTNRTLEYKAVSTWSFETRK
jgi:tetratricopeptide (TPR) repeat protein